MAADITPADFNSLLGKVRALSADYTQLLDPANPTEPASYMLSDEVLNAFLAINIENVHFAAAQALDVLATNEALVSKKIRTEGGLQTDGPAVAKSLQDAAKQLRELGREALADTESADAFEIVDYAEPIESPFGGIWGRF